MPSEATELSTATNTPTTVARSSGARMVAVAGTDNCKLITENSYDARRCPRSHNAEQGYGNSAATNTPTTVARSSGARMVAVAGTDN